jgi:hypothetical protein
LKKRQEEIKVKKMQQPATIPKPSLDDWFRDNPMPEPKKVGKPVSNEDEILSPIRKYENNPNISVKEQEIRKELKNKGKSNAQIGQLIRGMKNRGEV